MNDTGKCDKPGCTEASYYHDVCLPNDKRVDLCASHAEELSQRVDEWWQSL